MTLLDFLRNIYTPQHLGLSARTVEVYEYAIRSLAKHFGRPPATEDLCRELLLPWLSQRYGQVAPKTVKRERGTILMLWRAAIEEGLTAGPAVLPAVKVPRKLPTALTLNEFERLIEAAMQLQGKMKDTQIQKADWWSSLLLLLFWTGARVGATLRVRTTDVSLDQKYLMLRAKHAKTAEPQVLMLHDQVVELIRRHYSIERKYVWPFHYSRRALWEHLHAIFDQAGLPVTREYGFHCLRRTTYTLAWLHGSPQLAARQLGHHGDLSDSYLDPRIAPGQQAVDVLPQPRLPQRDPQLRLF